MKVNRQTDKKGPHNSPHSQPNTMPNGFKRTRTPTARIRLTLVSLLCLAASVGLPCQCRPEERTHDDRVRQEFAAASAVFSGHVENIGHASVNRFPWRARMAGIRVTQAWKGDTKPGALVQAVSDGRWPCGFEAQANTSLLVYARGQAPFFLMACTLTRPLSQARDDLPVLLELAATDRP